MSSGVSVRPALAADGDAVAAIFGHYVTVSVASFEEVPPGAGHWRGRIEAAARTGHSFLVAELEGRVVGFALTGVFRPKPAYGRTVEVTIYVEDGATGQGIGRVLLERLVEEAAAAGFEQMIAVVTVGVDPSSAPFFTSAGFAAVGVLPGVGHKHGRRLDIGLFQRDLREPR